MILPHRQKEIISELQEQIEILRNKARGDGQCVSNLIGIGEDMASLKIAISIIKIYLWRNP